MKTEIAGTEIYYELAEGSGVPVVLLHGWGGSHVSFAGVFNRLQAAGRAAVVIDFPGFGESSPPGRDWGIYDYANITAQLIEKLGLKQVILVGHSFGGRVSIIIGKLPFVKGIVLVDSAGMKPRRGARYHVKVCAFKVARKLGFKVRGGSADYRALSEDMRGVFKRVVNTHLECELTAIRCPTLIVWGKKDRDTPVYMAKRLSRNIADSAIVLLEGGHYAYIDSANAFYQILTAFSEEVTA